MANACVVRGLCQQRQTGRHVFPWVPRYGPGYLPVDCAPAGAVWPDRHGLGTAGGGEGKQAGPVDLLQPELAVVQPGGAALCA